MTYHLVVDFDIADSNGDGLVEAVGNLVIDLRDSSGDNTAILVLGAASSHCESLSRTGLSVA